MIQTWSDFADAPERIASINDVPGLTCHDFQRLVLDGVLADLALQSRRQMSAQRIGRDAFRAVAKSLRQHLVHEEIGLVDALAELLRFDAQLRT